MADQRISELNAITGANTADDDLFVIVDTSTNETKKIAKSELVCHVILLASPPVIATIYTAEEPERLDVKATHFPSGEI